MVKTIILFTVLPLFELAVLIKLSQAVGLAITILIVAVTGLLGAYFTKKQGMAVVTSIKEDIEKGSMPATSIIDGFLILIGGVMLITPGIITDIGGFLCIVPVTRKKIRVFTQGRFRQLIVTGSYQFSADGTGENKQFEITENNND